jgi:hypothetical protein
MHRTVDSSVILLCFDQMSADFESGFESETQSTQQYCLGLVV